jgi:hypothetical protein
VILGCAVVAVIVAWRLRAARLTLRTLCWWLASVAVFGAGVAIFDDLVYGAPLTTGCRPGEVTFGLGAVGSNLRIMPAHLMQAMPMLFRTDSAGVDHRAVAGTAPGRRPGQRSRSSSIYGSASPSRAVTAELMRRLLVIGFH